MPATYTHDFDTPSYKAKVTINTGLFIDGKFVDPIEPSSIEYVLQSFSTSIRVLISKNRVTNPGPPFKKHIR